MSSIPHRQRKFGIEIETITSNVISTNAHFSMPHTAMLCGRLTGTEVWGRRTRDPLLDPRPTHRI